MGQLHLKHQHCLKIGAESINLLFFQEILTEKLIFSGERSCLNVITWSALGLTSCLRMATVWRQDLGTPKTEAEVGILTAVRML